MKLLKSIYALTLLAGMMCAAFAACSSDNDKPDDGGNGGGEKVTTAIQPENVFPGKRIKTVGDMTLSYDTEGFVTAIKDEDAQVTFEYSHHKTRSDRVVESVRMNITNLKFPDEKQMLVLVINQLNGFVTECIDYTRNAANAPRNYWRFTYDKTGHLTKMERTEGKKTIEMTYENGDMISSTTKSENNETGTKVNITYTSADTPTPIENQAGIMLWDHTFNVDMDEMIYAYYAGLLGKPTTHLPLSSIDTRPEGDSRYNYEMKWNLDNDGYPTKVTIKDGTSEEHYGFSY